MDNTSAGMFVMTILKKIKGLHVLTDSKLAYPKSLLTIIESAISGGASVIQLRDKNASLKETISLGKQLQHILTGKNTSFIVNDNIEAALALNADGIHVGQKDTPATVVRKKIGKNMILGVSVSSISQAIKAQEDGADYIGVGPLFLTSSKLDADPVLDLAELREIKGSINIPVIAIGGITLENVPEVAEIADGIAVISAILRAENPEKTAMEFVKIIMEAQRRKNDKSG